jgi:DNA-binding transcriptional regulator YhcF (GntR family)
MEDSKYQQIVKSIREKILRGLYPPGGKLPGYLTLAKEYQVSTITSNRALIELERLGLVERRERSGTYVLERPQILTDVFVIVQEPVREDQPQQFDYWRGIVQQGQQTGLSIQMIQSKDPKCAKRVSLDRYYGQGLIFLGPVQPEMIQASRRIEIPHIYLGAQPTQDDFAVLEDRYHATADLVGVMIADGFKRIGFIGNLEASNHRLARDGYLEGIKHLGLGFRYIRDANEANIVEVTSDILTKDVDLDAMIVMGGQLPIAALPTILNHIPKIALGVLTESSAVMQLKHIAYTAFYSQTETGKMAIDLLQEIAQNPQMPPVVRYPAYQIFRPSLLRS